MLPVAVAIAMLGVIGAFGGHTRSAEAIPGDVCAAYVGDADGPIEAVENQDGQGNDVYVVEPGTKYGLAFRVEDIISGWLFAAIFEDDLDDGDPGPPPVPEVDDSFELALAGVLPGPNVHVEVDSETGSGRITSQAQAFSFETRDNVTIGGFVVDDLWLVPNVTHVLINPGVISQVTQTYNPRWFNNSSGFVSDSINSWLQNPAGMSAFAEDATSVCGASNCGPLNEIFSDEVTGVDPDDGTEEGEIGAATVYPCDDSWGYVDFECIESGYFNIDLRTSDIQWGAMNDLLLPLIEDILDELDGPLPPQITPEEVLESILYWNLDPARSGLSLKFYCTGQADTAEIVANPTSVEIAPVGSEVSASTVRVTVEDQDGDRIDGAEVTFTTDNCTFRNTDPVGENPISPAGGGQTVTTYSDTDTTFDTNYVADNPLALAAGTAEVVLNCATNATPGVANITAVVQRPGSDIVLETEVNVVGQVASNGLTLNLTPEDVECGETILASVTAVDSEGNPVSDGTTIYFTTDTSSGVQGGVEGAQGSAQTVDGEASVLIATDPSNGGVHTVIAYTMNAAGTPNAQVSETYTCEGAVAPVVPTVGPPGTGTGNISPPNTGDAGLAAGNGSAVNLFAVAGAVVIALAGLVSLRLSRN